MKRLADRGGSVLPRGRVEIEFAAAGFLLVASQFVLIRITRGLNHDTAANFAAVLPLILGLAVPAALLLALLPRLVSMPPSRFAWIALIAVGLLMRVVWFGVTPPLEDDYNRYLWDGAVVAGGSSPYTYAPGLFLAGGTAPPGYPHLAPGVEAILGGINYPEMRSIYPSVAQAAFALAHVLQPFKVDGLRAVFLGGELATLALLVTLLGRLGRSWLWAVAYWWNPLPAAMLVGLVHIDALIPPFVLGAVMMMATQRPQWAMVLIGFGAGVKVWPLLLAPMVLWPLIRDPRRLLSAGAVLAGVLLVAIGPVVWSAMRPGSGLSAYAAGWSNNNGFYAWMLYAVYLVAGSWPAAEAIFRPMIALATGAIALWMGVRGDGSLASLSGRALVVAAAVFYLSPAQFPWYAAWFLPLAALTGNRALLVASATLPAYYTFFPLWPVWNGVWFFYGTAFIHSLPVLAALLWARYNLGQRLFQAGQAA